MIIYAYFFFYVTAYIDRCIIINNTENVTLRVLKLKSSRRNNVKFGYMVLTILRPLYFLNKCVRECFPRMVRARNINIRETKCPLAGRLRFSSFLETIKNIFHNHLRELIFTQFILYPLRPPSPSARRSTNRLFFIRLSRFAVHSCHLSFSTRFRAYPHRCKSDCPRNIC